MGALRRLDHANQARTLRWSKGGKYCCIGARIATVSRYLNQRVRDPEAVDHLLPRGLLRA